MLVLSLAFRDYDPELGCQNFVDPMYPDQDPNLFYCAKEERKYFLKTFLQKKVEKLKI